MNQTAQGIGSGFYMAPHEGLDWSMWCGPAPLGKYDACSSAGLTTIAPGWTTAVAGRRADGSQMLDLPIRALNLGYPDADQRFGRTVHREG